MLNSNILELNITTLNTFNLFVNIYQIKEAYEKPKIGTCGEWQLDHFEGDTRYTYARCARNWKITSMKQECGCLAGYMNGMIIISTHICIYYC